MKRILSLFSKIFSLVSMIKKGKIKIKFYDPKKTDVLLIDHWREAEASKGLLNDIKFEVLDTRLGGNLVPDNFSRNPRIFISFRIIYFVIYFFFIKRTNSLFESYCYAYIKLTEPKLLLELTHYGFLLQGIKFFPNIKFLFILEILTKRSNKSFSFEKDENEFQYYLINCFIDFYTHFRTICFFF